ncbi:MAG: hypothetical protein ACR2PX_01015 [Endozoicomonas sp.]|uniref:hypothetical protein n=1 Tax=Endozoicomonas sp. TaxID=1892382 RepID=UPI003D9B0FD5
MQFFVLHENNRLLGFSNSAQGTIPADAILLSAEEHQNALIALSKGEEPYLDNGQLLFKSKIIPATERRLTACITIDNTAGQARARFATDSPFIEPEYELSYKEAVAFIEANYQGECPETVKAHAEAYSVTDQAAADEIKLMGDQWYNVLRAVRRIRLAGKRAVETAADDADFMAVAQPFIDQLNALQP